MNLVICLCVTFFPRIKSWIDTGQALRPSKGRPAKAGEYPFMVSLQTVNDEGKFEHYCGGSIANNFHVFTACHCVAKPPVIGIDIILFDSSDRVVVAGTVNIELFDGESQVRRMEKMIHHPSCQVIGDGLGWSWDYAFVKVRESFVFTRLVQPLPLYSEERQKVEKHLQRMIEQRSACEMIGWGVQRDYETERVTRKTSKLLVLNVYLMKYSECFKALCDYDPKYCGVNPIARKEICAYSSEGDDACQGDSGGPLVCEGRVSAVLGWGPSCGGEKVLPSMYSTVGGGWDFFQAYVDNDRGRHHSSTGSIFRANPDKVEKCMSQSAMKSFNYLRENNMLCDAKITLDDGSEYSVHRTILSACSGYFTTLFTTSLHSKEQTDIRLPGVEKSTFDAILDYAYKREAVITPSTVTKILTAADYFNITGLIQKCCDFIQAAISPENCIGILKFSRDHMNKQLEKEAHTFVMRYFTRVAKESQEILDLPVEEIKTIIGSDMLNVKSEEVVWEFVIRWIEKDLEARKQHIVVLMSQIRLGLMDTQFFLENVKEHRLVAGNELCRPVIIETLRFLYDLEMITQRTGEVITPEIARPRVPHEILFAIGGWSGGSPTNFIETYDTRADRWVKVEEVDRAGPRAYHGTAVIGFEIYVIGGFDGMDYFNSCRCFNAETKTWREIAPMNARRCYVSVAVLNDVIYAMGGYDGHHRQNTAEKYDYKTNQWTMIAPMIAQRSDASATTLNGKIYITGGFNGHECMNTAEAYDPETNQWTAIAPMRSRRSGVSCVGYHDRVYVIGGFNGVSRMCSGEKYNPLTNTWVQIPDMYNPRSNFAIEVIDDMIFAIGGFNGVTTIYHVECYDEKPNEWYEATDMNIYRSALSASVIMGLPNSHDYIHQHRDKLMEEKRQKLLALDAQRTVQTQQMNEHATQENDNNNVV